MMLAGLSASQTVPSIYLRGIRLGKAAEFMNSSSDETEGSSALVEWVTCDFSGRSAGKIAHFSSLLSKGELNCFGIRLSHPLGLAVMHKPGQGFSC